MAIFGLFSENKTAKKGKKKQKNLSTSLIKAKRTIKKKAKTCEFC
jgi:hypothetical protein